MTDEQILELAEQHFSFITEYTATGWIADTEDLLKFAREIRAQSFADGYDLAVKDYIRTGRIIFHNTHSIK